jgi:hypothetical protein
MKVKSVVNSTKLLQDTAAMFSNGSKYLTELAQNARRAGATRIHITTGTDFVEVMDNGSGVADFASLIGVATSEWGDDVQDESPYGIGFLACLFAAEKVTVTSGEQTMTVTAIEVIEQREVDVLDIEPTGLKGTLVRLDGVKKVPSSRSIERLFWAFPIPVYLLDAVNKEEKEVPRPYCEGDRDVWWSQTAAGMVGITPEGSRTLLNMATGNNISTTRILSGQIIDGCIYGVPDVVIHLDPVQFKGRIPDRDAIVIPEPAVAKRLTSEAVKTALGAYLAEMKANRPEEIFVAAYGMTCLRLGHAQMLNDLPSLPPALFFEPRSHEIEYTQSIGRFTNARANVESGAITLLEFIPHEAQTAKGAFQFHMAKKGVRLLDSRLLHPEHWVHSHVWHLTDDVEVLTMDRQPKKPIHGDRWFTTLQIILAEKVEIQARLTQGQTGNAKTTAPWVAQPASAVVIRDQSASWDNDEDIFEVYVGKSNVTSNIADLIADYRDEHDHYLESAYRETAQYIENALHVMLQGKGGYAAVLESYLEALPAHLFTESADFVVSVTKTNGAVKFNVKTS